MSDHIAMLNLVHSIVVAGAGLFVFVTAAVLIAAVNCERNG